MLQGISLKWMLLIRKRSDSAMTDDARMCNSHRTLREITAKGSAQVVEGFTREMSDQSQTQAGDVAVKPVMLWMNL